MLFSLTILFPCKYFKVNNIGFLLEKKTNLLLFVCVVFVLHRISLQGLAIRINHHHTVLLSFILTTGPDS